MCSEGARLSAPTRAPLLALCALAAALAGAACGQHYVARGADLYGQGHYVEAAEVFERTESRLTSSSASDQARFGVYRGATLLQLGDAAHAARWLGYAQRIASRQPDALGEDERELLGASLQRLAATRPSPPSFKHPAELATAPLGEPSAE